MSSTTLLRSRLLLPIGPMIIASVNPVELLRELGVHSQAVNLVATGLALLGVVAGGTGLLAKQLGRVRAAWKWIRGDEQHRLRMRDRALFARHVEARIRDLDNKEEWSDHRFAELEAEVETLGAPSSSHFSRQGLRRTGGLRRERSLSRALQKSRQQLILLQGDPGAGKSVALRHVARQMAERAMHGRRLELPIPLYINLKALTPDVPVTADGIHGFVVDQLRAGSDRDVHRFLDAEFSIGRQRGGWFFLFDSFDEIPAILSATDEDHAVRRYSDALFAYVHGMTSCRGVIASRAFRSPPRYGLPRFWIVPLSEKRKQALMQNAGLDRAQVKIVTDLPGANSDVAGLSSNPLFLGLLCDYVQTQNALPEGWHDVFEAYVSRRLASDADRIDALFGIGVDELRRLSEEIAFTMTSTVDLGLTPSRSSLTNAYRRVGFKAPQRVSVALDALEWSKLARSEAHGIAPGDPPFSFAHRRFQEYFATNIVLREPTRVSARDLLTSASWRETAVTLFQAHRGDASELLAVAGTLLRDMNEAVTATQDPFKWQKGQLHLLGVLQSGFAGNPEGIGDPVRDDVARAVKKAWQAGTIMDRKWALEVSGTAPQHVLLALLAAGLQGRSAWLRDVALRQVARLSVVPDELAAEIRRALLTKAASLELRRDWLSVRAQLLRLPEASSFVRTARVLRIAPLVDAALLVAVTTTTLRLHPAATWLVAAGLTLIAVVTYPSLMGVVANARGYGALKRSRRLAGIPKGLEGFLGGAGIYARGFLFIITLGTLGAYHSLLGATPVASVGAMLLVVLALSWGPVVAYDSMHRPAKGLFWFVVAYRSVGRNVLAALKPVFTMAARARWRPVYLVWLAAVGALYYFRDSLVVRGLFTVLPGGGGVLLVVSYVRGTLVPGVQDRRVLKRWRGTGSGAMTFEEFLAVVQQLRTEAGFVSFLQKVRIGRRLPDLGGAGLMTELLHAIEGRSDGREGSLAAWLESNAAQTAVKRIQSAPLLLDELGQLLEDAQDTEERPRA